MNRYLPVIKIEVKLYTVLKKFANGKILEDNTIVLPKGSTLQELINFLGIPNNISTIFLVNNTPQCKEYILCRGDKVKIFSFICGG